MAFSIPQTIQPVYTIPDLGSVNVMLNVGSAVKDLPPGAETTMKKANDIAVVKVTQRYQADSIQFEKDFEAAEIKAQKAEKMISSTRNKKAIAITLLVATIIATVATVVLAAVTQTWPILFIAAPCLIALVPSSYYTHIFRVSVDELEDDIAAPSKMTRPVLKLPVYDPKQDIDLQQTRVDIQNQIATMSLRQISETNLSTDAIFGYELLDRVTQIQSEKRPTFYAKCIQLINAYGRIENEYKQYFGKAEREYNKLHTELQQWKSQQDSHLQSQEFALFEQERTARQINEARRRGECVNVHTGGFLGSMLSRWELDNMRSQVAEGYGRRDAQNRIWYTTTVQTIKNGYQQASTNIEEQYKLAKAAAA